MMLIAFLASRPEAVRVSALPRSQMSNAVAGRIVQGASATTSPVWDHGVDGSGQVVQVGFEETCRHRSGWGTWKRLAVLRQEATHSVQWGFCTIPACSVFFSPTGELEKR